MLHIHFTSLRCHEETNEAGSDEPYVVVATADLANFVATPGIPIPIPAVEVFRIGPFGDVDGAETHSLPEPQFIWGVSRKPAPLPDPAQAIIAVGLMEQDDGRPESLRGIVKGIVSSSVFNSLSLDRPGKVANFLRDMNSALRTPTGGPSFDEQVGGPQELQFTADELRRAEAGEKIVKNLVFRGDGGHYTVTFGARNGVSLRSNNIANHFLRHRNSLAEISPIASDLDRKDATFRLVPGLADGSLISFESVNFPNHFLRHQNFELKLHIRGNDPLYRDDASFRMISGLADPAGVSFESRNLPGHFLRHSNFRMFAAPSDGSELFRRDATFYLRDGLG